MSCLVSPRRRTRGLVVLPFLVAGILGAACGRSSSPAPAAPVVGAGGGTVTDGNGAEVVVPPGALQGDVTIRVAKDSTGAPAVPSGLAAAGDTYVITPHGGEFAQPVEVRIPVPASTLAPTESLKLAKAQPGGGWQVLDDSDLSGGVLTARVSSFSFFVPVKVSYLLPVLEVPPLSVTTSLTCGEQDCNTVLGAVTATYVVATNSGQLPAGCESGSVRVQDGHQPGYVAAYGLGQLVPLGGGSVVRTLAEDTVPSHDFVVGLACGDHVVDLGRRKSLRWGVTPLYPDIAVLRAPPRLDLVEGLNADLEVVLAGATKKLPDGTYSAPNSLDRATVDWQRSDDAGGSWRTVARSYQDEANPTPVAGSVPWRYWSVRLGLAASAADQGALVRAHACYTPLDVAPPFCATGPATRLNVLQQSAFPSIVEAPRAVLVSVGQTASFSVVAGGLPVPTLQWQTRAANSSGAWSDVAGGTGATTGSYTTAPVTLLDNGRQYRVVATNALGTAASTPVTVSVSELDVAPTITTQPASLGVTAGSDAAFAIAAHGTEALSYQWRRDGTAIAGANAPVLHLAAVTAAQAGGYSVVVSNVAGSVTSAVAVLTVSPGVPPPAAPVIVTQPASVVVGSGHTATFAVGASGDALSFQWRKDGTDLAGATAAALTLAGVTSADAGVYSVVVSNTAGSVPSAGASLEIATAPPPVVTAPTITTQPATLVVAPGAAATLAVGASGSGPLAYQWSRDGVVVPGATDPVLHIASVGAQEAGSYTVTVGNTAGTVGSSAALLILLGAPVLTAQPAGVTVLEGSTATFTVAATGSGLGYQWLRNGTAVAGATGPSHTTPATVLSDGGAVFSALVYNGAGLVVSQGAVLTVTPLVAPSFTTHPADVIVVEGGNAHFTVTAGGTPAPTLQWQSSADGGATWSDVAGATGAALDLVGVVLADGGRQVRAVATNGAGTATSNAALLTVTAAPASQAWQTAVLLETDNAGNADAPQIAVNASGVAFAVWHQWNGVSTNIYANRYTPAGGWGTPALIETDDTDTAQLAQVAVDASGNAIAVWQQSDTFRYSIWANRYTAGAGWGTAAVIETGAGEAGGVQIAMDGAGNAIAVWSQNEVGSASLWSNRYVAGSGWGTAVLIEADDTGSVSAPQIAVQANGDAVAVWAWGRQVGFVFEFNVWSNRYAAGTGWGNAAPIDDVNPTIGNMAPHVAVDGAGNAIAVWHRPDASTWESIWSNRYVAGTGWGTPALVETDNTNSARNARVAFDGAGNAMAVWTQSDGLRDNVLANRYTAGTGWGTPVLIETDDAGPAFEPRVVIDASGVATAVWSHRNVAGFTFNIRANRWTAGTGWGTSEIIDAGTEPARVPQLGVDLQGNVLAVWQQSDGVRDNVWANRLQ